MRKLLLKLSVVISGLAIITLPLQASALDRVAATFTNGDAYLKEGPINAPWHQETSGVDIGNYSLSGNRISLLDQGNSQKFVNVKEPSWDSPWNGVYWTDGGAPAATKALVSQLSNGQNRLLVLRADGSVIMKDGPWNTGWWSGTIEPSNVSDIVIGGDRIGVIMNNGDLKVKQLTPGQFSHPNNTAWDIETTGATAGKASMTNTRIAYIDSNNNVFIKEGSTTAPWFGNKTTIHSLSSRVRLAGNRVCSLGMGIRTGVVECKDGSLDRIPTQVYNNDATDVKITQTRIGVVTTSSNAYLLEGSIYAANSGWQRIAGNATSLELN
jgi:hypothetical protein